MLLSLLSDIHLDFSPDPLSYIEFFIPSSPRLDTVLMLAGDIGNPFSDIYRIFLHRLSLLYLKVFIISGNHEYHHPSPFHHIDSLISSITSSFSNVHFLQRSSLVFNRVRFLGCTLWSLSDPSLILNVSDYSHIPSMSSDLCIHMHTRDSDWLTSQLALENHLYDHTVVMTHHLPSYSLISPKYLNNPTNIFYASMSDHLVIKASIWLCGHSHTPTYLTIGSCRCYINPVGYIGQNTGFILDHKIYLS